MGSYCCCYRLSAIFLLLGLLLVSCSSASKETGPSSTTSASSATTPRAASSNSSVAVAHGSGSLPPSSSSASSAPASTAQSANSQTSSASGIKWTAPSHWKLGPERQMRAATYIIPAASGDSEDAECAVFFNIGGTVEANINRWITQFEQPDGKSSEQVAKQKKETINGLAVTTVDLTGTFIGGGPAMGQGQQKKASYRLLGAIVEAPQGNVFFKLTGPAKTVAAAQSEFQTMLKSVTRQ